MRPNFLILITDQQRAPRHWPDEPGWADALMPADAELRRTGLTFTEATCNSCMCTPSRASLLTGLMPSDHGCSLTLTAGGAEPRLANVPGVLRRGAARRDVDPRRALGNLARTLTGLGAGHGPEPELSPDIPNLAHRLRALGYEVGYRGKWHLTRPLAGTWAEGDAVRLEQEFGFAGWEPPDAGEDIEPEHFGGGTAAWDEVFTRQAEAFLAHPPPEPFALVVSLVNPHDVLAYPSSYERGGYRREEWADLDVPLPPTVDEDLRDKPSAHRLMGAGQGLFLGTLASERAQRDYLAFYAHLHRVVDRHIGRIVAALGEARERTVIVRLSDHGEMGLAHGGMRQKMFNAYEETLRVPLTFSNPAMFPQAAESAAPASLIDVLPTLLSLAGSGDDALPGADLSPILKGEAESVQDHVLFTFDDHQAGTARANVVPPPNRIRCVREPGWKYATYVHPDGGRPAEHELYDLQDDPFEERNLVDVHTGAPRTPAAAAALERLQAALGCNP